jgi:hypothetical protein
MEAIFDHKVVFGTKGDILVKDVANSLLADELLLRISGMALEKCFDGLLIEKINVKFISSSTNSPLTHSVVVEIIAQFQPKLNKAIPALIEKLSGIKVE